MKKLKSILALIFAPAIAWVVAIYSADEVTSMLGTIIGITTLAPLVVEPLKQLLKTTGWLTRILSALVVYLMALGSWWLEWGMEAFNIYVLLIVSALMTLGVWGYLTIDTIKMLIAIIIGDNKTIRKLKIKG